MEWDRPRLIKLGLDDIRWRLCSNLRRPLSFGGCPSGIWPFEEVGLAGLTGDALTGECAARGIVPAMVTSVEQSHGDLFAIHDEEEREKKKKRQFEILFADSKKTNIRVQDPMRQFDDNTRVFRNDGSLKHP